MSEKNYIHNKKRNAFSISLILTCSRAHCRNLTLYFPSLLPFRPSRLIWKHYFLYWTPPCHPRINVPVAFISQMQNLELYFQRKNRVPKSYSTMLLLTREIHGCVCLMRKPWWMAELSPGLNLSLCLHPQPSDQRWITFSCLLDTS